MNIKVKVGSTEFYIRSLPEHMFHPLLAWLGEEYKGQVVEVEVVGF